PLASRYARRLAPSRSEIITAGVSNLTTIGFASPARLSIRTAPTAPAAFARSSFELKVQPPREMSAIAPDNEPAGSGLAPPFGSRSGPQSFVPLDPEIVATSTIVWSVVSHSFGTSPWAPGL